MDFSRRKDKESNRPCFSALVSRQQRTSVMGGAYIASDHQLVRSKIKLKLKRKQKNKAIINKSNIIKLQQPAIKAQFALKLRNTYEILQDYDETDEEDVEEQWQDFEDAYKETAQEVLGYKKKGQNPWISKESWELEEEKTLLKNNIEQTQSDMNKQNYMDKYRCTDKEMKKSMRQVKRKWIDHLAMEEEEAARNGRMKEVYDITKTLSNGKRKTTNAVKDKYGNFIMEGLARRERWKEHFEDILNRHTPGDPVTDVEIDPVINETKTDTITKAEIRTALKKMKNGKTRGKKEIAAELLKAFMNTTEKWLVCVFRTFWEQEKVQKKKKKKAGTDHYRVRELERNYFDI